jgi:NAD(P)-dependent dehydrogenase (short-subunit alcohol dehydrogenase family)
MWSLEGKVAVITGGTSGIGARTAEVFVANRAKVVIAGRRAEKGEALVRKLGAAASFRRTDVTVEAEIKALIDHVVSRFGRLDCLINNAGTGSKRVALAELDLDDFDAAIAVHLRAALAGIKHAVRPMTAQKSGSIINVASINGMRAGLGSIAYSLAKAGAIHLTRCAAVELGELGIRVNTICPGPIATGIFGKGAGLEADEADSRTDLAAATIAAVLPRWQPLPRVGIADDIANAAVFLASDASSLVTGHNLVVDGGITAGWPAAVASADIALFRQAFREGRAGLPAR